MCNNRPRRHQHRHRQLISFISIVVTQCVTSVERRTIRVRILGNVLQASEMLVPDRNHARQVPIFFVIWIQYDHILISKRFRGVGEQRKTEERNFRWFMPFLGSSLFVNPTETLHRFLKLLDPNRNL